MPTRAPQELDARLGDVLSLVRRSERLVDIGTDHAWLPIAAVRHGVVPHAIGVDVSPHASALGAKHAAAFGQNRVDVLEGDGFVPVEPAEGGTVTLVGMYARTMMAILEAGWGAGHRPHRVVAQPNRGLPELRGWMATRGWAIVAERIAVVRDRYFSTVAFELGSPRALTEAECEWGPLLMAERSEVFVAWTAKRQAELLGVLEQIGPRNPAKSAQIRAVLAGLPEGEGA